MLSVFDLDQRTLPVDKKVQLLVESLDGAERTNEALACCEDGEAMLAVLLGASDKLGLGLTRNDLTKTAPIRDWIWWKNNDAALFTVGDGTPRHQQDVNSDSRRFIGPGVVIALLFIVGMLCGF